MPRPVLVVLDPLEIRRTQLATSLSRRYEVRGTSVLAEAEELIREHEPVVVAISLTQNVANGLEVGRSLSGLKEAGNAAIVVYGPPPVDRKVSTAARRRLEKRYHIDTFVARPFDLDDLVHVIRAADRSPRVTVPPTDSITPTFSVESARRAPSKPKVKELLSADVSLENIRALLTAELGPEVLDELDEDTQEVAWSELLRARASSDNLRKLLRKELVPKRPKTGKDPG